MTSATPSARAARGARPEAAGKKVWWKGTHRARPPGDTVRLVEPHLERFGITRVADVTGLDVIGIPVTQVIRPNARTLSVAAGKGVDLAEAKASGLMEAIEVACAEAPPVQTVVRRADRLRAEGAVIDTTHLPVSPGSTFREDLEIPWVEGLDLLSQARTWVPAELVDLDFVRARRDGGPFRQSSGGLASGNTWEEAVLHGLCELVERDDDARLLGLPGRAHLDRLVDLASVDPVSASLVERFRSAGIAVAAWEMTGRSGLPSFTASIADPHADPQLHPIPVSGGSGCHTNPSVALCRALLEAAQSRLTEIVGSREDIQPRARMLSKFDLATSHQRVIAAASADAPVAFESVASLSGDTIPLDLERAVRQVASAGVQQVVVVDLTPPGLPVSVVRVIVPGLNREDPWARLRAQWGRLRFDP